MSKTKEYSSDVQQKIVDHHKIESGCKKRAKELKISILSIRAILRNYKKFQSTKDVTNPPGR